MKFLIQHKIQLVVVMALAFLLLTGGIAEWSLRRSMDNFSWVNRNYDALIAYGEVIEKLVTLESANLRFAISGDEKTYEVFPAKIREVQRSLAKCKQLTQDDTNQPRHFHLSRSSKTQQRKSRNH